MVDITPIGYVKHEYPDDEVKRMRFVDAVVEILPEYEEGLSGLEEFSHIIILACLHKFRSRPLVVRPKRVVGAPEVGVFATDSPDRPNPIAVSIVRLLRREGGTLHVDGVDLFDGTPVLDIKGFSPKRCPESPKAPWWAD
ncbi:putative methyltransferase, YaeB/AF_0241 family [Pyrobaculum sp. WP30]|nr:putative methyltransferase, YaeB/AF_0241 family [Pyrobaculum sp. WP30]